MIRFLRLCRIMWVSYRFGLDQLLVSLGVLPTYLNRFLRLLSFGRRYSQHSALRLRLALESLGPVFVKFGQILSTRRDLIPANFADELSLLCDQVPAFSPDAVQKVLEKAYSGSVEKNFSEFDLVPVASASVAQVHFAVLQDGTEVAVKLLRPNIEKTIRKDTGLMQTAAWLLEKMLRDGPRLRPVEIVQEFSLALSSELDLLFEGANCTQLRRNFEKSDELQVPKVYWDASTSTSLVMQRMHGLAVDNIEALKQHHVDLKALACRGVNIFFTQVFRDGFFHADMHPGNIFVHPDGAYIALDFGIMGSLTEFDKHYLARNFIAFFNRDYRQVALNHVRAGWAPKGTRVERFEAAIRAVCEPIFDRPLHEISFGKFLLRLFQVSREFQVPTQPQLILLQKTLLNVEGLGRQLDPNLDLWKTAKPYLERWMRQQLGLRGMVRVLQRDVGFWQQMVLSLPQVVDMTVETQRCQVRALESLLKQQTQTLRLQHILLVVLCVVWVFLLIWKG